MYHNQSYYVIKKPRTLIELPSYNINFAIVCEELDTLLARILRPQLNFLF